MYRNRTRRHHRTAQLTTRQHPELFTARRLLAALGFDADFARRYAGAWSTAAKKTGITPAAVTYTRVNGRNRRTYVYDLTTQALQILAAVFAYKRTRAAFGLAA